MKRLTALILAVLLLSLSACTQREAPTAPPTEKPVVTEEPLPTLAPEDIDKPEATPEPEPEETPEPSEFVARLEKTEDAGIAYQDKFVFLGDSTTYGMKYYGVLSGGKNTTQVWTPSSGTLTLCYWSTSTIVYPDSGGEITIPTAAQLKQPEYMLITLGVNGVSFMDEEYFKTEYKALIEAILEVSPDTKIIVNSIYPVAENYEHIDQINNEKISAANGWLEDLATEMELPYLDTYSLLIGDNDYLRTEYENGDHIHLNETGFGVVLDNLRTHAYLYDGEEEVEETPEPEATPEPTKAPVPESTPAPTPVPANTPKVDGIAIYFGFTQMTDFTIRQGDGDGYVTLTGIVLPSDLDIDSNCHWFIEDSSIAKITPNGRYCDVEYVGYGSTKLTFTCFDKSAVTIVRCIPKDYKGG